MANMILEFKIELEDEVVLFCRTEEYSKPHWIYSFHDKETLKLKWCTSPDCVRKEVRDNMVKSLYQRSKIEFDSDSSKYMDALCELARIMKG